MHPLLEHLSIFSLDELVESEDRVTSFLQDMGLIPSRNNQEALACPKCHGPMECYSDHRHRLGFRWTCKMRLSSVNPCKTAMCPLKHTFFGNVYMDFRDIMGLIIGFVMGIKLNEIQRQMIEWKCRRRETHTYLYIVSITDFYKKLTSVCETIVASNNKLLEGTGTKKSYLDCYRSRRLPLSHLGHKIHTILMDIKSLYPYTGKKLTMPSSNSLNTESVTVKIENDVSLGTCRTITPPSIVIKTENSLNNENVNLLNEVTRNSDASSSDTENSCILGTPLEDIDLPLEPEVILHDNDEDSCTREITDTSVASFKDKNVYSLLASKEQQCNKSKVQLSAKEICQEKSTPDKSDFSYPKKKRRRIISKRMPFNEYLEKNKNKSAIAEKGSFLSIKKEEYSTQPVIHKIKTELPENT